MTIEDPWISLSTRSVIRPSPTRPRPGRPDGTVVEVFRKGYAFKDRLLRPALVKVAKGPKARAKAGRRRYTDAPL